jgi:hypothetical protein
MEWFASLLPATVIAAIALFFVKEVVESIRRWRADARKGRAFRTLLARECELNHWTYKRLKEALLAIQEDFQKGLTAEYSIRRLTSGEVMFRRQEHHGRGWSEGGLPDAHTDLMSKVMLDVATLDKSLFACLEPAYDAAINMSHVRESFMRFIESDEQDRQMFFRDFLEYGLDQLEEILADLENLYRKCTGKKLEFIRVR